jgi:UDP-MurNAc hydroxylase
LGVDAVYISHVHPDHYDPHFVSKLDRNKPIIVLDAGANFLPKLLERQGFTNLIKIRDQETKSLGPFQLTAYAPFTGFLFHESEIGNVIDSAIVLDDGRRKVLNTNDNTPTAEVAAELRDRHGKFDLALLNYNAAGPYPACFDNLSLDEKKSEGQRLLRRNLDHMTQLVDVLRPSAVMPFAGSFVLCGHHWQKTFYNGTTTWDAAAEHLSEHAPRDVNIVVMNEGQTLDLDTMQLDTPYVPADSATMAQYVEHTLSKRNFPFESDPQPDMASLRAQLSTARKNLWRHQQKFSCFPQWTVAVKISEKEWFSFRLESEDGEQWGTPSPDCKTLFCSIDPRALARILSRKGHWNNMEVGFHISFDRRPNEYVPDIHVLMSFFHC